MHDESPRAGSDGPWLVACLCAAWCHTCGDYRGTFEALARERPDFRFAWIDIEDDSDALGPLALDVENFPTLLIARGETLRFYGTVLPHAATLRRTVEAARHAVLTPAVDGLDAALVGRLHELGVRVS
ncbi:MAG TPA: thioredoxin family protein [Caldimonas sp.]